MENTTTALLTDIQRFSLHDGPGVRTTFFFKGCPLRCLWCSNPETFLPHPELFFSRSKCIACGACAKVCPRGCIQMGGQPKIDRGSCRKCCKCAEVCPTTALVKKGVAYTVEELLAFALADKQFYERSGGGVTASGGEPLLQSEAVAAFFRLAKQAGLHTAIETSGHVSWDAFERVLPHCDLVHMDIKHADAAAHRRLTGVGVGVIHDNLSALAACGANVVVRTVMVPGCNMDEGSINALAALLQPFGFPVELLLFHQLGQGKFEAIGLEYELRGKPPLREQDLAPIKEVLEKYGINLV